MRISAPSSHSSHTFSQVPQANIPRSRFDRSHVLKTTMDASGLVPIFVDEVLPGDTFNLQATLFGRLSTPIKPVMDNLYLDTFFFFVPNRLVWENWEKFNGAQTNPGDSTSFAIPQIAGPHAFGVMSIGDYFGLPTTANVGTTTNLPISALPFRAYNLIWNEWFRDQNLQTSLSVPTGDGPDLMTAYAVRLRGKRHDYFTSCLPWPQKGTSVTIPLGTYADVKSTATIPQFSDNAGAWTDRNIAWDAAGPNNLFLGGAAFPGGTSGSVKWGTNTGLYADLLTAVSSTINDFRAAFQLQRLYERDARGGTRYTEILLSHFGVVSPDFRLQRPEYLGGGSQHINFTPIAQTQATGASGTTTPQGNLSAFATVVSRGNGFTKSFVEHGYVIGLANVRADLTYQQGYDRMWTRQTRFEFYWPALSHLGEQTVLNREIYAAHASPLAVFGYQERYAEYRYKSNQVTGQFRSSAAGTLDIWHLAQNFGSAPALNSTFIQDSASVTVDRVIATPSEPQILLDCYFKYFCARPMPVYSVPGLIDHF